MFKFNRLLSTFSQNILGFNYYRVSDDDELPLDLSSVSRVGNSIYSNPRSITLRLKLEPGRFVIVPCTFEPDFEGEFCLRVFTETPSELEEL